MEALSPRSTNLIVKPKVAMERKVLDKNAAAAAARAEQKSSSKIHAPPPPLFITEPGEDGETYSTGGFLGKGGFAVCYEGTLMRNGRVFAMKVVKSEMNQKKMEEKFRTELQIHSKMRHPHIVQFHRAFAYEENTYVVLELCPNGSVMDMVRKRKCLSLPEVRRFMIQLCGAVKYLHKRNVAHRDLKMGNLFLDHKMDIKVGDFGLAAIILSEKDEKRRRTLCGTPNYIAPEVLDRSKGGHTQKVDIWSLGVICFAMLTGYPPFQSKTQEEIYKKVRNLTYVWPKDSECANYIPEEAKSLVSSCLSLAEDERPEPDEIVELPFFHMYDGCIPKQLDPSCRLAKPTWLKAEEPRGDRMVSGNSLDWDPKFRSLAANTAEFEERYRLCKNAFYSLCGVGKKPDGSFRKAAGKNCSKSAYAECLVEDESGLRPVIPLPQDFVYKWPHDPDGDWSIPDSSIKSQNDSLAENSVVSVRRAVSLRSNGSLTRTQAALAAAQQRRNGSQSHAATLRQQALAGRGPARPLAAICDPPAVAVNQLPAPQTMAKEAVIPSTIPTGGFAERPIRNRRGVAAAPSASQRDLAKNIAPQIPKSSTAPNMLTVGKTRSQSRKLEAASQERLVAPPVVTDRVTTEATAERPVRTRSLRSVSRAHSQESASKNQQENVAPREQTVEEDPHPQTSSEAQLQRRNSKATTSSSKYRSALGLNPLFHLEDKCELLPHTSSQAVIADLAVMLTNMIPHSSRRRSASTRAAHAYVIKWVDYTNRYGIGYVLDDGSVGCVFKAENGQPASCVVVRDGEKHIRRKARSAERRDYHYAEADQLIPQTGRPVEFYEDHEDGFMETRGIRRAFIPPTVFEVKGLHNGGAKIRTNSMECLRADAEKIKRVKLVDQFGKYMIGALGRHGEEGLDDNAPVRGHGQFIKFYQRLGNVGVWGFGDGAFQFNFPDHTKLVISPGRTRTESPWVDFYHLSASAARYLAAKGRMHPSGFDTRDVASDEAATFFAIAHGKPMNPAEEKMHEMLNANSFLQKISFIREVFKRWIKGERLGGRPLSSPSSFDGEDALRKHPAIDIFWEGIQERPREGSGGKFVWVTVGAPGGDGEYVSVSLKDNAAQTGGTDGDLEVDALRERLRALVARS